MIRKLLIGEEPFSVFDIETLRKIDPNTVRQNVWRRMMDNSDPKHPRDYLLDSLEECYADLGLQSAQTHGLASIEQIDAAARSKFIALGLTPRSDNKAIVRAMIDDPERYEAYSRIRMAQETLTKGTYQYEGEERPYYSNGKSLSAHAYDELQEHSKTLTEQLERAFGEWEEQRGWNRDYGAGAGRFRYFFPVEHLRKDVYQKFESALTHCVKGTGFNVHLQPRGIVHFWDNPCLVIEGPHELSGAMLMDHVASGTNLKAALKAAEAAKLAAEKARHTPPLPPDLPKDVIDRKARPQPTTASQATATESSIASTVSDWWSRNRPWGKDDTAASAPPKASPKPTPKASPKPVLQPSTSAPRRILPSMPDVGSWFGGGQSSTASTNTASISAPSSSVSSSSASYGGGISSTAKEAENGKAGLIALGVGAAAIGGWALWEMSKREQKEQQGPPSFELPAQ